MRRNTHASSGLIRKWSAKCQLGSWAQGLWAQGVGEGATRVQQIRPFSALCLPTLQQSRYLVMGEYEITLIKMLRRAAWVSRVCQSLPVQTHTWTGQACTARCWGRVLVLCPRVNCGSAPKVLENASGWGVEDKLYFYWYFLPSQGTAYKVLSRLDMKSFNLSYYQLIDKFLARWEKLN